MADAEALEAEILRLCRDAFRLRMNMRGSKEGYACVMPRQAGKVVLMSENEDLADAFGVEGPKNCEASDEIQYTLFGALVKHPEYRGEEMKVLEKAQVVHKRKL